MGAWGAGGFQNDTAMDYVATIETLEHIDQKLLEAETDEELPADLAAELIAAAECVAAMKGNHVADLPDDLGQKLKAFGAPSPELVGNAQDAVSTVLAGSELLDLWAQSDDRAAFNLAMTGLISRLNPDGKPQEQPAVQVEPAICVFCNKPIINEKIIELSFAQDLGFGEMTRYLPAHLSCANAALHPAHLIQIWEIDDALAETMADELYNEQEDD
ncbi:MAG: DUF4259 domain-containing protein [Pseudomonadota bacterium]